MCVLEYHKESHPSLSWSCYSNGGKDDEELLRDRTSDYSPAAASVQNIALLVVILRDVHFVYINTIV